VLELHNAIMDNEAFEMILRSISIAKIDVMCANILAQRMAIPKELVPFLSSYTQKFKDLFAENPPQPLTLDILGNNIRWLISILRYTDLMMMRPAFELMVDVLCHVRNVDAVALEIIEALKLTNLGFCVFAGHPLVYMLSNAQKFSVEQFKVVLRVSLKSKLRNKVELELLYYLFPGPYGSI
jgi:hypothetical protein